MADTAELLARLHGVRKSGPDRWMAKCPAHEDSSPSLSVRAAEDGRTLVNCMAGCEAGAVVGAVGLTLRDLFPAGNISAASGQRFQVPVADVLAALEVEALTVAVIATDLAKGAELTEELKRRLMFAAGRISVVIENGKERRHDKRYRGI